MKKHELLKYAYDNYPKGVKFDSPLTDVISTGKFTLWQPNFHNSAPVNGVWRVDEDGKPSGMVFDGDKWAEIIPESILSDKCAIQVNNEREYDLLAEHYTNKCWPITNYGTYPQIKFYDNSYNGFSGCSAINEKGLKNCILRGIRLIPFAVFAKEIGIEVPVFVMTSEDGVDLYEQDFYYTAIYRDEWHLDSHACSHKTGGDRNKFIMNKDRKFNNNLKAFSTKEAAESWIKEQNKPKSIPLYTKFGYSFEAIKGGVKVTYPNTDNFTLSGEQVEQMYEAYKSLQS